MFEEVDVEFVKSLQTDRMHLMYAGKNNLLPFFAFFPLSTTHNRTWRFCLYVHNQWNAASKVRETVIWLVKTPIKSIKFGAYSVNCVENKGLTCIQIMIFLFSSLLLLYPDSELSMIFLFTLIRGNLEHWVNWNIINLKMKNSISRF